MQSDPYPYAGEWVDSTLYSPSKSPDSYLLVAFMTGFDGGASVAEVLASVGATWEQERMDSGAALESLAAFVDARTGQDGVYVVTGSGRGRLDDYEFQFGLVRALEPAEREYISCEGWSLDSISDYWIRTHYATDPCKSCGKLPAEHHQEWCRP